MQKMKKWKPSIEQLKHWVSSLLLSFVSLCLIGRQTYFLPVIGLVDPEQLHPGDLVGVNKDSYLILETLPQE